MRSLFFLTGDQTWNLLHAKQIFSTTKATVPLPSGVQIESVENYQHGSDLGLWDRLLPLLWRLKWRSCYSHGLGSSLSPPVARAYAWHDCLSWFTICKQGLFNLSVQSMCFKSSIKMFALGMFGICFPSKAVCVPASPCHITHDKGQAAHLKLRRDL